MRLSFAIFIFPVFSIIYQPLQADTLTPELVVKRVLAANPQIKVMSAKRDAESALISAKSSLPNPKIGIMRENSPSGLIPDMDPMYSLSLSQEFMWPSRYSKMRKMQQIKTELASEELNTEKLELRKKALLAYYSLFTASKILTLLQTQNETLREISRVAEARRAAGQTTQQDEMKTHVEQTKIEMEIILQKNEISSISAELNALMNQNQNTTEFLSDSHSVLPKIKQPLPNLAQIAIDKSRPIKTQQWMVQDAQVSYDYVKSAYYPELMVAYSKPFIASDEAKKNYTLELQISVPIWASKKESAESTAAALQKSEAESQLELIQRETEKNVKIMSSQLAALDQIIKVYETTLIPQAQTNLNVSRKAYSVGQASFQDLLDAERVLYSERIDYYRNYLKFVENILNLETTLGISLCTLPFDGGNIK